MIFSPIGNLLVSGSKDSSIRFYDIMSGLCIKTITSHLGEISSLEFSTNGFELLSCSKDNRLYNTNLIAIDYGI